MQEKPGWKTTEYWLSVAALVIGALIAADVFPADSSGMKVLVLMASVLTSLGYTVSRGIIKGKVIVANALAEANKANPPQPSP